MSYTSTFLGDETVKKAGGGAEEETSDRRAFWREFGLTAVQQLPGTIQAVRAGRGGGGGDVPLPDVPYPSAPLAPAPAESDNTLMIAGLVGGAVLIGIGVVALRRR